MHNGKSYIGYTGQSIEDRWQEHLKAARNNSELLFHRAIRKYGDDSWKHEILARVETQQQAVDLEIKLILENNTFYLHEESRGYNMTLGGEGSTGHVYSHSEEARQKISESLKGKIFSEERRLKISQALKGKKKSDEHRENISKSHMGYEPSIEARINLSQALKGKKKSDEHKTKIGNANRGRKHTAASKKNMSEARRGIKQSDETKKKRSVSLRIFWENKKMMEEERCTACYNCLNRPELGIDNTVLYRMVVCIKCGNKRCPHATSHKFECTNSNEPNQPGSRYQETP